jgi:hypothetical protein
MATMEIDKDGQIIISLETCKELCLKNNDWLRVCVKSDHVELCPACVEVDESVIEDLIHQGILIDVI